MRRTEYGGYKYVVEFRINKKGAECFRTEYKEELEKKLRDLREKKPNTKFTVQERECRCSRYWVMETRWNGEPAWGVWRDLNW